MVECCFHIANATGSIPVSPTRGLGLRWKINLVGAVNATKTGAIKGAYKLLPKGCDEISYVGSNPIVSTIHGAVAEPAYAVVSKAASFVGANPTSPTIMSVFSTSMLTI